MLMGQQTAEPAPAPTAGLSSASYQELGQGLMLLRASTMKMVRLQLAMERRDRRVAMEALDELVVLDGRIRDLLTGMPADSDVQPMRQQLDEERNALVRERLLLATGKRGPALARGGSGWADVEPAEPEPQPAGEASGWQTLGEEAELARKSSALPILVTLMVLAFVAAAAAILTGTTTGRNLLVPLLSGTGAS